MVHIISDTSTLYSTAQARQAGFAVSPLSVTIADKTYREFDEISADAFVEIIDRGHMPTSSQPAIGEVTALYEEFAGEQILNIAMAHGLSGTYMSAVAAIKRGFKGAVKYCVDYLQKQGIGKGWKVYISHAAAPDKADLALAMLKDVMPEAEYEIVPLSPAFITQGGPKCMAIQYVEL